MAELASTDLESVSDGTSSSIGAFRSYLGMYLNEFDEICLFQNIKMKKVLYFVLKAYFFGRVTTVR